MNILYIDDDPAEHKFLGFFLKKGDHPDVHLTSVETLDAAVAVLQDRRFDLVFLDDRCRPYSSCLETLPHIQSHLNGAKIAIVSSSIEATHLQSAEMLGVDRIIDKAELRGLLDQNIRALFEPV